MVEDQEAKEARLRHELQGVLLTFKTIVSNLLGPKADREAAKMLMKQAEERMNQVLKDLGGE